MQYKICLKRKYLSYDNCTIYACHNHSTLDPNGAATSMGRNTRNKNLNTQNIISVEEFIMGLLRYSQFCTEQPIYICSILQRYYC